MRRKAAMVILSLWALAIVGGFVASVADLVGWAGLARLLVLASAIGALLWAVSVLSEEDGE